MTDFKSKRLTRRYTQTNHAAPERVFPLLCGNKVIQGYSDAWLGGMMREWEWAIKAYVEGQSQGKTKAAKPKPELRV